jgi:hypothetical protein
MWAILTKTRNAFSFVTAQRFYVLRLETMREVAPKIPITILRYDIAQKCPCETLRKIKGARKDWVRRWLRGDMCYVACADTEPLAYLWICHGKWRLKDKDKGRPLPQRCAFLYDARTREHWRGNRVYQTLISRSARDLLSCGYESLYLLASDRDLAARHAPEKLGFRRTEHCIRVYRFLRLFRFRRDRVTLLADAGGQ